MRVLSIVLFVLMSCVSFAQEISCIDQAGEEIAKDVAKSLGVSVSEIQVRYIGGENLDSDLASDGVYLTPTQEYFDVFLADDELDLALSMYLVDIDVYTDSETSEVLSCETTFTHSIPEFEWQDIYDTYL